LALKDCLAICIFFFCEFDGISNFILPLISCRNGYFATIFRKSTFCNLISREFFWLGENTESRRADQERDRERNNQRFAELWRKIGEVRDKLFNTARANHEIERNLGAAIRNTATAKQNLDAINQSLEQSRKAEQRQSRGWSMNR